MKLNSFLIFAGIMTALAGSPISASAQGAGGKSQAVSDKRVTLKVDAADIRSALKLLFDSAGANYTLEQSVQGAVTISLQDVPFRTALESVLRSTESAVPLTYRIEDGVYNIVPRAIPDPIIVDGPGPIDLGQKPAAPPRQKVGKINLNYAGVRDIVAAFGGTLIENRFGTLGMGSGFGSGFGGGFGNNMSGFGGFGSFGQGMGLSGGFIGGGPNGMMGPLQGGFGNLNSGGGLGGFGQGLGGGFRRSR